MEDEDDMNWDRIETNNPAVFDAAFLPEDSAKHLVCSSCKSYLSVRPVSIDTETSLRLCGRCKPDVDEKFPIDSGFYTLSDSFLFPCQNAKYGCRIKARYDEMKIHETRKCDFMRINCPMQRCELALGLDETINHFCSAHRDSLRNTNQFHVSQNKNCTESKLLHFGGKYYVVELDMNTTEKCFTISIENLDRRLGDFQYVLHARAASKKNKNKFETSGQNSQPIKFCFRDITQRLSSINFYLVVDNVKSQMTAEVATESKQKFEFGQE